VKIHQLHTAVKKHKIDEDADVIELKNALAMQDQEAKEKLDKEN